MINNTVANGGNSGVSISLTREKIIQYINRANGQDLNIYNAHPATPEDVNAFSEAVRARLSSNPLALGSVGAGTYIATKYMDIRATLPGAVAGVKEFNVASEGVANFFVRAMNFVKSEAVLAYESLSPGTKASIESTVKLVAKHPGKAILFGAAFAYIYGKVVGDPAEKLTRSLEESKTLTPLEANELYWILIAASFHPDVFAAEAVIGACANAVNKLVELKSTGTAKERQDALRKDDLKQILAGNQDTPPGFWERLEKHFLPALWALNHQGTDQDVSQLIMDAQQLVDEHNQLLHGAMKYVSTVIDDPEHQSGSPSILSEFERLYSQYLKAYTLSVGAEEAEEAMAQYVSGHYDIFSKIIKNPLFQEFISNPKNNIILSVTATLSDGRTVPLDQVQGDKALIERVDITHTSNIDWLRLKAIEAFVGQSDGNKERRGVIF